MRLRRELPHRAEELADEALGRPAQEADRAARAADPQELAGRTHVIGHEHHAHARQHGVERAVRVGQRLRVALLPVHVRAIPGQVKSPEWRRHFPGEPLSHPDHEGYHVRGR